MIIVMQRKSLTKEQEDFVWYFICFRMDSEDKDPNEVISENYDGDRSRYLQVMADWHEIEFCDACGSPNKKDPLVFQKNVEGSGVNLCSRCAIEYQTKWRPKEASVEPNILKFVNMKKSQQR